MKRDKLGKIIKGNVPYNYKKNLTDKGKICACCGEEKELEEFGKNKHRADGYHSYCKNCCLEKRLKYVKFAKRYIKEYYHRNKDKILKANKERYLKNKNRYLANQKKYYQKNKEHIAIINKEWRENNREKSNGIKNRWKKRNPGKSNHYTVLRRMRIKNQVPENADLEAIREFYKNCPKDMEVDHITPVSKGGLHTIENFQYLTPEENRIKSNKL